MIQGKAGKVGWGRVIRAFWWSWIVPLRAPAAGGVAYWQLEDMAIRQESLLIGNINLAKTFSDFSWNLSLFLSNPPSCLVSFTGLPYSSKALLHSLSSSPLFFIGFFLFFFFRFYLFIWEREREREQAARGMSRYNAGLNPRTLGSWPELKADAQPTEPPRCPHRLFSY